MCFITWSIWSSCMIGYRDMTNIQECFIHFTHKSITFKWMHSVLCRPNLCIYGVYINKKIFKFSPTTILYATFTAVQFMVSGHFLHFLGTKWLNLHFTLYFSCPIMYKLTFMWPFMAMCVHLCTTGVCSLKQETLLLQRDRVRHLSVEILQLQNISLKNPIVWHYLRDSMFSHLIQYQNVTDTHTQRNRQMDRYSIALRGKNRPYCTAHQV